MIISHIYIELDSWPFNPDDICKLDMTKVLEKSMKVVIFYMGYLIKRSVDRMQIYKEWIFFFQSDQQKGAN